MPRRVLTEKQELELVDLVDVRAVPPPTVAERFGCSLSVVHSILLKHGVRSPDAKPFAPVPTERRVHLRRDGRTLVPFTQADDERLRVLEAEGYTLQEIGDRMDPPRHRATIKRRLEALARRDAAEECAA